MVWWKSLWGSTTIIVVSIIYVIIGGFDGRAILAAPWFLVGAL